ncbi:translesion DNA synthesis-associated protein ImuA [Aquabacterium sp.]|uniref:translesion DNA synthesis-associated protein ImuA n=1 Tax=Aquabacterium sp. TaxID=1872578 RepID=UPI002E2F5EAF|nr:translesion DNA synthesis-associated protein ImuA [Aquabacterium sp.]HEX5312535.1 translesion DNA synthesis-associated protein ImuA [Aquabacterium sp.]
MHTVQKTSSVDLPEHLRPSVWTGAALCRTHSLTLSSGHPQLDPHLPGGGWPVQSLTEILQAQAGQGEWRLLLPALRQLTRQGGSIILIGPPQVPYLPGLYREGIAPDKLIWVDAQTQAQRLWATEQALQAACLTAILSWLPHARPDHMRRLQSHAARHPGLLFALRPLSARHESSAAPLRLGLHLGPPQQALHVNIFKRKGPLLEHPLTLPIWHQGLAHLIAPAHHAALDGLDTRQATELAVH